MSKLSIRDVDLNNKRVFVRVDFNVPLEGNQVTDETRISAAIPTIRYAIYKNAKVILASHLGRPKGQRNAKYSLAPVALKLAALLEQPVTLAEDCVGAATAETVAAMNAGEVVMLENLRFHPEEEANDEEFSRQLAALADVYVNDAFGTAHRAHASTVGITHFLKPAVAGFLMERELRYLGDALLKPERPFVVILGGAKVSDKIEVIQNLLKSANAVLIGGAMAYTFLKANGLETGRSLVEADRIELALQLESAARASGVDLRLPIDHVVAPNPQSPSQARVCDVSKTPADLMGLDIGPATREQFAGVIKGARTVIWNGPMGMFERKPFDEGTHAVAKAVVSASEENHAVSIVGGGDSVAAITEAGMADKVTHISTGGGATLEFLSGQELPGVAALTDMPGT